MATRKRAWHQTQPSVGFRKDPWYYVKYDTVWALLLGAACTAMALAGFDGLFTTWSWWLLPAAVAGIYVHIMAEVFVHNCSHVNFPRAINRLVGEVCGAIVLTRYASWEILHRQHHRHSDDEVLDPHPVQSSFWRFLWEKMIKNLEPNLHLQYFEQWGDTPRNRRRETVRSVWSFLVMVMLLAFWTMVLGVPGFLAIFVPATAIGLIHVSHFNWATHDGSNPEGDFRPVNLDTGFFWLGNRLWFGLYYHANHHEYAGLFNPMHLDQLRAERAARKGQLAEATPAVVAASARERE